MKNQPVSPLLILFLAAITAGAPLSPPRCQANLNLIQTDFETPHIDMTASVILPPSHRFATAKSSSPCTTELASATFNALSDLLMPVSPTELATYCTVRISDTKVEVTLVDLPLSVALDESGELYSNRDCDEGNFVENIWTRLELDKERLKLELRVQ